MSEGRPLRILLVEDEIVIALYLKSKLEGPGHLLCRWVPSGESAVEAADEGGFDLILMDIRLSGGIDGVEAARRIRAAHDIPVIFMTGYEDEGIKGAADAVGPLAYLSKPFGLPELRPYLEGLSP